MLEEKGKNLQGGKSIVFLTKKQTKISYKMIILFFIIDFITCIHNIMFCSLWLFTKANPDC